MKAIIPVGGRGTRMRPVTFSANKHFIPVGNKPLIYYPIETVARAGVKEIAITYNPGQLDLVKEFLGTGEKWNVKIEYVLQEKPIGLANIVEVCESWVGDEKFFLHLGDNIFVEGINELVHYFESSDANGLLPMLHHHENTRLGVPYFDDEGQLVQYVEKPEHPPHDFAVPGLYFADKHFFEAFKGADRITLSPRGEYEIPAPFQWMIDHGYKVEVKEYKGKWLDPGKFDDWLETNQYLLEHTNESEQDESASVHKSEIKGKVTIGKNSQIIGSTITGPVSIGKNVVIKNCQIGPFTSIYDGCILEQCQIDNSVLMERVTVKSVKKTIESSIIGPQSEIGGTATDNKINLFLGELSKISF